MQEWGQEWVDGQTSSCCTRNCSGSSTHVRCRQSIIPSAAALAPPLGCAGCAPGAAARKQSGRRRRRRRRRGRRCRLNLRRCGLRHWLRLLQRHLLWLERQHPCWRCRQPAALPLVAALAAAAAALLLAAAAAAPAAQLAEVLLAVAAALRAARHTPLQRWLRHDWLFAAGLATATRRCYLC